MYQCQNGNFNRSQNLQVKSSMLHFNSTNPVYSRVEVAADARHKVYSCGSPPQMPCNEADAVRSARLKSKLGRHIIEMEQNKGIIQSV